MGINIIISDPAPIPTLVPGMSAAHDKGTAAYLCNGPVGLPPISDAGALEAALAPSAI